MIHQRSDHRLNSDRSDRTHVSENVTLINGCTISALRCNAAIVCLVIDRCSECVSCVVVDVYRTQ
jgi:hypothetical protein